MLFILSKKILSLNEEKSFKTSDLQFFPDPNKELDLEAISENLEEIEKTKPIGSGLFGIVYNYQHNNINLAVKVIKIEIEHQQVPDPKKETPEAKTEREINTLLELHDCSGVLKCYGAIKKGNKYYIFTERMQIGLDFFLSNRPYSWSKCRVILKVLVNMIHDLHQKNHMHRDLKPENIMMTLDPDPYKNPIIKMIDLGFCDKPKAVSEYSEEDQKKISSVLKNEKVLLKTCGTPFYIAPEVLKRAGYTKSADYWSLGIILYNLLYKKFPFYGIPKEVFQKILNFREVHTIQDKVDEKNPYFLVLPEKTQVYTYNEKKEKVQMETTQGIKDILSCLLNPNPIEREVTFNDLLKLLNQA